MGNLALKYKIWLETGNNEGILGDGKLKLLKTISETGSLKVALEQHDLSYRKTWDNLRKIEEALGFSVIERQRGGKTGGNTTLTPKGQAIINAFDKFHEKHDNFLKEALKETLDEIKEHI